MKIHQKTKLPQGDLEVILLRSTMSGLRNTPPSGDRIGSHKPFFADFRDDFGDFFSSNSWKLLILGAR